MKIYRRDKRLRKSGLISTFRLVHLRNRVELKLFIFPAFLIDFQRSAKRVKYETSYVFSSTSCVESQHKRVFMFYVLTFLNILSLNTPLARVASNKIFLFTFLEKPRNLYRFKCLIRNISEENSWDNWNCAANVHTLGQWNEGNVKLSYASGILEILEGLQAKQWSPKFFFWCKKLEKPKSMTWRNLPLHKN